MTNHRGFTLAELLVVIAVLAILGTVAVVIINPSQILAQQRDSNRVSDITSLSIALQQYQSAVGGSMGTTGTLYISVPDPQASTTAGSQCQGLGFPTSSAFTYHCAGPSYYKNTDGTGWIPVNLKSIGSVVPLATFPTDPTNTTSTGLYYAYSTSDGTHFEVTAIPESTKQKAALGATPLLSNFPDVIANGSSPAASLLFNPSGLVGYWSLDEGTSTAARDGSGNGNNGTWAGGTPYYSAGKTGSYAGNFTGSGYVSGNIPTTATTNITAAFWVKWNGTNQESVLYQNGSSGTGWGLRLGGSGGACATTGGSVTLLFSGVTCNALGATYPLTAGTWTYIALTRDTSTWTLYANGVAQTTGSSNPNAPSSVFTMGAIAASAYFGGALDDVRVYNRTLTAPEIKALYNAEK